MPPAAVPDSRGAGGPHQSSALRRPQAQHVLDFLPSAPRRADEATMTDIQTPPPDPNPGARPPQPTPSELTEAVYHELRALAAYFLQRERAGHTLQPTALVHEAYLKLADKTRINWR